MVFVDFCSARVEGLVQVCSTRVEGFFIFNASSFFSCSAFSGFVPICSMYVAVLCVFFERGKQPVCQVSKVYIYFFYLSFFKHSNIENFALRVTAALPRLIRG